MRELNLAHEDFLDLAAEVLQRGALLQFRARGTSMAPSIRSGDLVTVAPASGASLRIGDVALCRDGKRAIVHRVVGRRESQGRVWIRLAGDAVSGSEELVEADQALGRVARVERGAGDGLAREAARRVLRWLQSRRLYRAVVRTLVKGRVECSTRVEDTHARLGAGMTTTETGVVTTLVSARLPGRDVGRLHLRSAPEGTWLPGHWIFDVEVASRWWGGGIGTTLMETALRLAAEQGAGQVSLFVFADNRPALGLFRKLGFRTTEQPTQAEMLQREREAGLRPRIVMSLQLP